MCPTGSALHGDGEAARRPTLRSAFEMLDVDRDGKISPDDLRTFYTDFSLAETASEDELIGTMISVADSNKDGFVEYEEFEKVVGSRRKNNGSVMEDVFRAMDKDGDGKVGHQDLKAYLNSAGLEANDEDVNAMIKLGGGDEHGGVTFEGLCKILCI